MPEVISATEDIQAYERSMLLSMWIPTFLDGECFAFALAMHRGTGWPMFGLMQNGMIRHAVVQQHPKGKYFDARGPVSEEELGLPFSIDPPYDLRPVEQADFFSLRPVPEKTVEIASHIAAMLWPDLPWKPGSPARRLSAFLDALRQICNQYGFWIIPGSAGHPTTLCPAVGDEIGYTVHPASNGLAYVLEQQLREER